LVQPDSPAAVAGLADHDCVVKVDGNHVDTAASLEDALRQTRPGARVLVQLLNGRVLRVRPGTRNEEIEKIYCEYVRSVRVHIKVFVASSDAPPVEKDLQSSRPIRLGELRSRVSGLTSARVVQGDTCDKRPPLITDDPGDDYLILGEAVVYFGYENIPIFKFPPDAPVDSASQLESKWPRDAGVSR
jgi:hypothetical protein